MKPDHTLRNIMGQNIWARRKKSKLTQKEVADAIGMCRPSLTMMEDGKCGIPVEALAKMARLFGCSVLDFFPGIDDYEIPINPIDSKSERSKRQRIKFLENELKALKGLENG